MGAYVGKGKRTKFGVGGFLIGIPGKDGKYYTLTNLGTGLTDEQFREMYKLVNKLKVAKQPAEYMVDKNTTPDMWVKPQAVLEVLADEITPSPRHTVGYSLRFPRLIRVRDDKNPEQATSVHEVKKLYKMQTNSGGQKTRHSG
jgi:DNA ligase-1